MEGENRAPKPQTGRMGTQLREARETVRDAERLAEDRGHGLREPELVNAYRGAKWSDDVRVEVRICVCGSKVKADPDAPAKGVQAHNFTSRHKAWRLNRGEDDPATWVQA